jgi:hypothetical protein
LEIKFYTETLDVLQDSHICSFLALKTLERKGAKQLGPRPWMPAVRSEFQRSPAGAWL